MPRTFSAEALASMLAPQTDRVWISCVELDGDELAEPLRFCDAGAAVEYDGHTYEAYPFAIAPPEDSPERQPTVTLRLCNVDRRLVPTLRNLTGSLTAVLWIGMVDDPLSDPPAFTPEAGPWRFTLRNMDYDAEVIELSFAYEDLLNLVFPAHKFDPQLYPGLFPL
jgi:hypothetical protein